MNLCRTSSRVLRCQCRKSRRQSTRPGVTLQEFPSQILHPRLQQILCLPVGPGKRSGKSRDSKKNSHSGHKVTTPGTREQHLRTMLRHGISRLGRKKCQSGRGALPCTQRMMHIRSCKMNLSGSMALERPCVLGLLVDILETCRGMEIPKLDGRIDACISRRCGPRESGRS
jgi:hypothetical protein